MTTLKFFLPQLILGTLLGSMIAAMGVILVLRKKAFFGITVSQVISSSMAISLFLGIQNELFSLFFSCIIFIPLLFIFNLSEAEDTVLGIIFVSFTAFTQILLNFGGNVKNHIMSAYFGDILTSQVKLNFTILSIFIFCLILFVYFYPRILFLSFDRDEYIVRYGNPFLIEFSFYFCMTLIISISVNILGSFYSVAHLLLPAFVGLFFARSMKFLFLFSIFFSIVFTVAGFILSLQGFQYQGNEIYLPTSSAIISLMSISSIILILIRKLVR